MSKTSRRIRNIRNQLKDVSGQLTDFMESTGNDAQGTRDAISSINTILEEKEASAKTDSQMKKLEKAGDAAVNTTNAVLGSLDKFKSGDATSIAIGVFDIAAELSQFLALGGPEAKVAAAIIGPLCSIISSILGASQPKEESMEEMLDRVVREALADQTNDDLRSASKGLIEGMSVRYGILQDIAVAPRPLSDTANKLISDVTFSTDGIEFLGKLDYYIQKDMSTSSEESALRVAKLLNCYATVAFLRVQQLLLLSSLYYSVGAETLGQSVTKLKDQQLTSDKAKFSHLTRLPNENNHLVYAKIHYLDENSKGMIEAYIGKFSGHLCTLYNVEQKQRLICESGGKAERARCYTTPAKEGKTKAHQFRIFNIRGKDKVGNRVKLFSIGAGGYVYAASPGAKNNRRLVNVWTPGGRLKKANWTFEKTKKGLTIKNNFYNEEYKEYMYADDKKKHRNGRCPVHTWMKDETVSKGGYWEVRIINE